MSDARAEAERRVLDYLRLAESVGVEFYEIVSGGERTELNLDDVRTALEAARKTTGDNS